MHEIRTRFAPSPTGYMHIGNLRTALYAFLIARHMAGTFILRIEDTDRERSREETIKVILDSLALAGMQYDEGPDKPGKYGPYVQSQRIDTYKKYADELLEMGHAYRCFCTKDELEERRNLTDTEVVYKYDGKCRALTAAEIERNLTAGKPYVIRQKIDAAGESVFTDHVYGEIEIKNELLDDQVLIKTDGYPTYNFANVIDDHCMEITHVVRGCEYLSSTPKYNLLYSYFGWQPPEYIHLPHIIKEGGKKLSKRESDASFLDLTGNGYLPAAVINYIALLGWSPGGDREFFSLEELIEEFSITKINKSSAIFSIDKLKWFNGMHIRKLSVADFSRIVKEKIPADLTDKQLLKIAELIQPRIEVTNEIAEKAEFFYTLKDYDLALLENKKNKVTLESGLTWLKAMHQALAGLDPWENQGIFEKINAVAAEQNCKTGSLIWPLRIALSGLPVTPGGATEIAEILGKEETLNRIKYAIDKLEKAL